MTDIVRDDWRNIPNSILTLAQQQDAAKKWEEEQRRQLAENFAAQQQQALNSQLSSLGLQVDDTNQNFVLPTATPISSRPTAPDSLAGAAPTSPPPLGAPASDSPIESIPWSTADQLPKGVKLTFPGSPAPIANQPASQQAYDDQSAQPAATQAAPSDNPLVDYARQAAQKAGIDPGLFVRQIDQESHFDPSARSGAGAQGIAQIVPKWHPGVDPSDPYASLDYAANLMRELTRQYGGDVRKALIAYNGGGGAVAADERGQTYGESAQYVKAILGGENPTTAAAGAGGAKPPAGSNLTPNQFGDASLSADEAMAACGPAAAVAFARANGRNPTLREALDLAKGTGWTADGGMNGVGNQKALLDKMGIPAELDTQPTWLRIKAAVQAGQVTAISTPAHYFVADDYDADTGKLHVGASGTAFRNGAEWMTPEQIVAIGGTVNGALFTKRTTERLLPYSGDQAKAPTSEPSLLDRAGQAKDAVVNAASDLFGQWQNGPIPGSAPKTNAQRMRETQQPILDAARTDYENNPGTADQIASNLGSTVQRAGEAVQSTVADQMSKPIGPTPLGNVPFSLNDVGEKQRELSPNLAQVSSMSLDEMERRATPEQKQAARDFVTMSGGTYERALRAELAGPMVVGQVGNVTGAGVNAAGNVVSTAAKDAIPAALANDPAFRARQTMLKDVPDTGDSVMGTTWTAAVRATTDRGIDLKQYQAQAQRNLGRPLSMNEMASEASRLDPNAAAQVHIDEALKPAVAGLSKPETDLLSQFLMASDDIDVAAAMGKKAAAQVEGRDLGTIRGTAALDRAEREVNAAQKALSDAQATAAGVQAGTVKTRASITLDAANRQVAAAQDRVTRAQAAADRMAQGAQQSAESARGAVGDAFFRARDAEANAAYDAVMNGRSARLVTDAERNALVVAEDRAARAGRSYGNAFTRNPDNPALGRLARQAAAAEDRVSTMRMRIAQAATEREESLSSRASQAAEQSSARGAASLTPDLAKAQERLRNAEQQANQVTHSAETGYTPRQAAAAVELRWAQRGLAQLQHGAERGDAAVADRVARAQARVQKLTAEVQQAEQEAIARRTAAAQQKGAKVEAERTFSGNTKVADAQRILDTMKQSLPPEQMADMEKRAQMVWDFGHQLLQRKRDAGLITDALYKELTDRYPHYVPARILDHQAERAGVVSGRKLTVRDNAIRANSLEGTALDRENPLASMVRYAYETEKLITRQNTVQAFLKLSEGHPQTSLVRQVPNDHKPLTGFEKITVFRNGEPVSYVLPKHLAETVNMATTTPLHPIWTQTMGVIRSLMTSRNPLFLPTATAVDAMTFLVRESSRAGGPQYAPKVAAELVKGYATTLDGLLSGKVKGDLARYLKQGGGMYGSSFFQSGRTQTDARKIVEALRQSSGLEVNSADDLKRLVKATATMKPLEELGFRLENAPRVASMRLAEQRGQNALQATINGRTVTMDFAMGGTATKFLNQFIPFFNVGVQALAQTPRAFQENPKGFVGSTAALLMAPTALTEVWNRADPERSKAYDDVPQYLKDTGVIFMLPVPPNTDRYGDKKPQYLYIPTREFSPFVVAAREAVGRGMGAEGRSGGDLATGMLRSLVPVQGPEDLVPPGVSTAIQLKQNEDYFRGRQIVSKYTEEQASTLAKEMSGAMTTIAKALGASDDFKVSPAATEFVAKDLTGGVGQAVLAGREMLPGGKPGQDTGPQSAPVVGGLYGRWVRDQGGETARKNRDQTITPSAAKFLRDSEVTYKPGPVSDSYRDVQLTPQEQAEVQRLANRYVDEAIQDLRTKDPDWAKQSPERRDERVRLRVDQARERAIKEVTAKIPDARWAERKKELAAHR